MNQPQLTHHIQLEILRRILTHPAARYSDLKPDGLEPNLFVYHLKQLMRIGLIEKQDKSYILTREGKHFADRVTLETMKVRLQPKIVTLLTVKRADGQWLTLFRKNQPFQNFRGFPSGKMHHGETLVESARRELYEKSGLSNVPLSLKGCMSMRFTDGEATVNHVLCYVFYGEVVAGTEVNYETEYFTCRFMPQDELFTEPSFGGHQKIFELIQAGTPMFIEEYESISAY